MKGLGKEKKEMMEMREEEQVALATLVLLNTKKPDI